jgi:hypothetical protein
LTQNYQKKYKIRRILVAGWPFALAFLVFLGIRMALRDPAFVDHYYSEGFYPFVAKIVSSFSRLFPFSLWDIFWVVSFSMLLGGLVLALLKKIRLRMYCLRIAQFLALGYSFFYILWGFNYLRPGIEIRRGWEKTAADPTVFKSIFDSVIVYTDSSFTRVQSSDYPVFDKLIEESYRKNSQQLGIRYPGGTRRPKKMIFSSVMAKFGLSGYFGPYFNEIHLNSRLLPMEYPFVLAHEKAHQFGITSESEANLIAFIVCTTSSDRRLQYSGYLYILSYFLSDANQRKDYKDFIKRISKPVIEDLRYQRKYYMALQNKKMREVQSAANNVYLKTNFIKTGIKNYNQVVSLVIGWYQNSGKETKKQGGK